MKILVTGGAGFIGSHVADRYLREGHEVHILDNLSSGSLENVHEEAAFHRLDIESEAVVRLFERERFGVLVHLAAQLDVRRSVAEPKFDAGVNILGFLNLMEAGRKYGLERVIFSSTGGAIYGEPNYTPQDEAHTLQPLSPYGITKLTAEKYLHYYEVTFQIPAVILRYSNVYGPRQHAHGEAGVVAIFISRLLAGETPCIYGDGNQTRDYVFVEDVVEANYLALQKSGGGTYNVGTGVETTVNELFERLQRLFPLQNTPRRAPQRAGEQLRSVLSYRRIREELGWQPRVTLQEGLQKTVDWFKSRTRDAP